ncbi:MAG: hypothetical protein U5Q44_03035 [Dehalococcoidia bacterium]|nr:hypothetical protein [Dehalococcoidia bacterium]
MASSGRYAHRFFSTAKISQEDLPGAGVVEFFLVDPAAEGVTVMDDWNGFGMRSTESHTVRYEDAPSGAILGFPGYIESVQPLQYWFLLFAAIPVGCARSILHELGTPAPRSPRAPAPRPPRRRAAPSNPSKPTCAIPRPAGTAPTAPNLPRASTRTEIASSQRKRPPSVPRLCALGGGRHCYRQDSPVARAMADAFAGVSLRPPLALALDTLCEQLTLEEEPHEG